MVPRAVLRLCSWCSPCNGKESRIGWSGIDLSGHVEGGVRCSQVPVVCIGARVAP